MCNQHHLACKTAHRRTSALSVLSHAACAAQCHSCHHHLVATTFLRLPHVRRGHGLASSLRIVACWRKHGKSAMVIMMSSFTRTEIWASLQEFIVEFCLCSWLVSPHFFVRPYHLAVSSRSSATMVTPWKLAVTFRSLCMTSMSQGAVYSAGSGMRTWNSYKLPFKLYSLLRLGRWYTHVHENRCRRLSQPENFVSVPL